MVKDLSPKELSTLWMLHGRHTTRHAVETAIELGLPLWTEAVHLARAFHRSNMDLANGAYYVVGSDFVDNEDNSQYAYHEIGRYPDVRANDSFHNMHICNSTQKIDRLNNDIEIGGALYLSDSHKDLVHPSTPMSVSDARNRFESERSKQIQLFLEGVSSAEIENLHSERSSLEVCEISDDNESLCTRSCAEARATPLSEDDNEITLSETKCALGQQHLTDQLINEKMQAKVTSAPLTHSTTVRKARPQLLRCSRRMLGFDYDFSSHDKEISRYFEVPSTLCTRSFTIIDRLEFERRLLSENEHLREEGTQVSIHESSSCGDSEVEDSRGTVMGINDAVSHLAPDLEMNEVISKLMKEDVAAEFSDAETPVRRSKRHYVEPFDGDLSMTESEFSDSNIDVNILYEISELRREEGASSPSSCSIGSDDAVPPDVCVWHPQTWTYNIDLITYFRAPSPSEETMAILVPREYVELIVAAPEFKAEFTAVELAKRFPHSGAFTRKKTSRFLDVSFNVRVPSNEHLFMECEFRSAQRNEHYQHEILTNCAECVSLKSVAPKDTVCLSDYKVNNDKKSHDFCEIQRVGNHRLFISSNVEASKYEFCSLVCNIDNAKQESQGCYLKREDCHVLFGYLASKASSHETCAVPYEIHNAVQAFDCCQLEFEDRHFQSTSFAAKVVAASNISELCTNIITSSLAPKENRINVSQVLVGIKHTHEGCSAIFTDTHLAHSSFDCSVPKSERISSYWEFDILLGNSTFITLKDKRERKATYFCEAPSTCAKRKPLSVDDYGKKRKRGDSLDEVLLLLETGAMPSQYIDVSPTHSLPRISKSLNRNAKARERASSGKDDTIGFQPEVSEVTVTPNKRPASAVHHPRNPEQSSAPRSDISDFSDSPDRLVICEDEDMIVQDTSSNVPGSIIGNLVPSAEIEPLNRDTAVTKKSLANVANSLLMRRSLRKRGADLSESSTVKKKKRRELLESEIVSSDRRNFEDSVGVASVVDTNKGLEKVRKLSGETSMPTSIFSRLSKSGEISEHPISDSGIIEPTKATQTPQTQKHFEVSSGPINSFTANVSLVSDAAEHMIAPGEEGQLATVQLIGQSAICRERISLDVPTFSSSTKLKRKTTIPIVELRKKSCVEIAATFVGVSLRASAGVQFSIQYKESVSFECVAPAKETGLDILANVAVSTEPTCFNPVHPKDSKRKGDDSVLGLVTAKRARNRRAHYEASPSRMGNILYEAGSFFDEVQTNAEAPPKRDAPLIENLSKSPITPTITEKKKNLKLSGAKIASGSSKQATTVRDRRKETDRFPHLLNREGFAINLKMSSKVDDLGRLSNRNATREKIRDTNVRSGDNEKAVIRKGMQIQTGISSRSSKRRRVSERCCSHEYSAGIVEKSAAPVVVHITPTVPHKPSKRRTSTPLETVDSESFVNDTSVVKSQQLTSRRRRTTRQSVLQSVPPSHSISEARRHTAVICSSAQNINDDDEVMFVESSLSRSRRKSLTPPILVVAVDVTTSFVPIKRDNSRFAEPLTLPTRNCGEPVSLAVYSSDSAEVLNALALDIIIREASALSAVNLATFAQFVLNLLDPVAPIFTPLEDIEPSTLPANFTTIFERSTPLQFRHRLDYNSFNSMLLNRLPENGLHALTLDLRKVSMLKITKFVDTVKESVEEICEELRTRKALSKAEVKREMDLSSEVQQLITSRYVETMMKMADACNEARHVSTTIIADRFHLLLCGWMCFLQQGGVLRVRLQLCPGRSHPGIVDITTAWLDQIDTVLSRAQATKSMRTSAFAVSLAQEKTIVSKVWFQMASHTSTSCEDGSYIFCEQCKLHFRNEDTDFIHNRVFHQKSRECEECYDMFHTLLGLDLHMVGSHKRYFATDL